MTQEESKRKDAHPIDLPVFWTTATDNVRMGAWRVAIQHRAAWWKVLANGQQTTYVRDPGISDNTQPPKT